MSSHTPLISEESRTPPGPVTSFSTYAPAGFQPNAAVIFDGLSILVPCYPSWTVETSPGVRYAYTALEDIVYRLELQSYARGYEITISRHLATGKWELAWAQGKTGIRGDAEEEEVWNRCLNRLSETLLLSVI